MPSLHRFKRRLLRAALPFLICLYLPLLLQGCATPGAAATQKEPPPANLARPCVAPVIPSDEKTVTVGELFELFRWVLVDYADCARKQEGLVRAWPK